ncbi:MAG TPA: TonB-dependent receptor [Allosphingosinicella sp.]|nr:TonB-dependent receptor [Allosphingosinicella sp.]
MKRRRLVPCLIGGAAAAFGAARAQAQDAPTLPAQPASQSDLSTLSIEDLAQLTVRSASKRDEPLSSAPTAVFVITNGEILDSAATTLPDVLRLAPNLGVQQVNGHEYAITARGFNSLETSNKLLVLVDGRSVYSTLHSGVFWDTQTPFIEDIDQIEVISGPGGTLYGPNAVNGVISISTRDARETLGGLVRGGAGAFERNVGGRYGFALGERAAVRVYAHYFDREDLPQGNVGPLLNDRWRGWQAGFRADFGTGTDEFTLQGDIFDNEVGNLSGDGNQGHNLLARWTHGFGDNDSLRVQAYYDDYERRALLTSDSLQVFDLDVQYNATLGAHDFVIGGGLRTTRDEFVNNLNGFQLNPPSRRLWVYNAFLQDRIRLSETLSLIAGVKVEETSFTGIEILPNLRLAWQPDDRALLWAAVSRAVRTPSRIDRQLEFLPLLAPGDDFVSEKLIAFEAGYRGQPTERTTLSVNVFFNLYDDIRTTEFSPGMQLPIRLMNGIEGHSWGVEAWSSSQLLPWWRLSLGVSTLFKHFRQKPGHLDLAAGDAVGHDPEFQLFARSQFDLSSRLRINAGLRFIDGIESDPPLGSYVEADAQVTFRLTDRLDLYAAGLNLLHDTHQESNDPDRAQRAQRSLLVGARVRF